MPVSVTDIEVRIGRTFEDVEKPRVEAFITDASALIGDYCGSDYSADSPGIRAVLCSEVIRWLSAQPGVTSERVGDIEVTFAGASAVQQLSPAARSSLKRYRRKLSSISLTRGSDDPLH
ncbi:hypothetical protein ABWK57_14065 [Streptomyces sp. NPDC094045]|uniref:hypothetical protein n=1 Tax=unclassified Streptomyces TaxID=2593676 RepID=UPI003397F188